MSRRKNGRIPSRFSASVIALLAATGLVLATPSVVSAQPTPPSTEVSPSAVGGESTPDKAVDQHEISPQEWTNRAPVNRIKVAPPKAKWSPTQRPNRAIESGKMRSDREEIPEGFTKADADKAEMMEATLAGGNLRALAAPGCQVYWPAPYEV